MIWVTTTRGSMKAAPAMSIPTNTASVADLALATRAGSPPVNIHR